MEMSQERRKGGAGSIGRCGLQLRGSGQCGGAVDQAGAVGGAEVAGRVVGHWGKGAVGGAEAEGRAEVVGRAVGQWVGGVEEQRMGLGQWAGLWGSRWGGGPTAKV